MAKAGIQVQVTLREIHAILCEECREKLKVIIREKISEQLVDQVIGEEGPL